MKSAVAVLDVCRYSCFKKLWEDIENNEDGGLDKFTRSYEKFGINAQPDGSVYCHEWCPGAQALYLRGEFSQFLDMLHKAVGVGCFGCQKHPQNIIPDAFSGL